LIHNKFNCILFQSLLDFSRFGITIIKNGWIEDKVWIKQPNLIQLEDGTRVKGTETSYQAIDAYHGNKIVPVSPYHFFPDTRFPLTQFEEGEFCADEFETSRVRLREREAVGDVAGIKHIQKFDSTQNSITSCHTFH